MLLYFATFIIALSALLNIDAHDDDNNISTTLFIVGVLIRFILFMTTLFMIQIGITDVLCGVQAC